VGASPADILERHVQRNPQIPIAWTAKPRGHHADNGVRIAIELERFAKRISSRAKMRLPKRVTEKHNAVRAFLILAGRESAAAPALLRREPDHVRQIDWSYAGGIAVLHLLALLAFVPWFFSWTGVLLVPIGMYTFGTLGINIGLHRLLTHRSLACPRWLERTLVLMGTCGFMDSPAYWVAVHRRHHQFADEERDPHSPSESFFWSHLGWYLVKIDPARRAELVQRYARDILRDPLYAFLERNGNWLLPIVVSWLLLFALGWGAALAAGAGTAGAVQFGASVLVWGGFARG